MPANLAIQRDIFAANRATGHIALSVAAAGGVTRRQNVHEDGSLRVRFPNATPEALEAVIGLPLSLWWARAPG
jgi:urease accessory protein